MGENYVDKVPASVLSCETSCRALLLIVAAVVQMFWALASSGDEKLGAILGAGLTRVLREMNSTNAKQVCHDMRCARLSSED